MTSSFTKTRNLPGAVHVFCQQVTNLSFQRAMILLGAHLETVDDTIIKITDRKRTHSRLPSSNCCQYASILPAEREDPATHVVNTPRHSSFSQFHIYAHTQGWSASVEPLACGLRVCSDVAAKVLDGLGLSVPKAAAQSRFAAADFSRIRNAGPGRFTLARPTKMLGAHDRGVRISLQIDARHDHGTDAMELG